MVQGQINLKPKFYRTFLKILRSTPAIEHVADKIEDEVERILKKGSVRNPKIPKLDLHEDGYSSGFQSEPVSTMTTEDTLGPSTAAEDASLNNGDNTEVTPDQAQLDINMSPQQDTGDVVIRHFAGNSEISEESVSEENRPLQNGEKISGGIEESFQRQLSAPSSSIPVYHGSVAESFDKIHRVVECEKAQAEKVILDKDSMICSLRKQIEDLEIDHNKERIQLEKEIESKEKDLVQSEERIKQKTEEMDALKKTHENDIQRLEEQHKQNIEKRTSELAVKSQVAQQKIQKLEQELQSAKDEKTVLQQEKSEVEREIENLKSQHAQNLEQERKKHEEEMENLKRHYDTEIGKLQDCVEKDRNEAKLKADYIEMLHKYKMSELKNEHKDNIAELKDKITSLKDKINTLERENIEADAQVRISEARRESVQAELDANAAAQKQIQKVTETFEPERKQFWTDVAYQLQRSISSSDSGISVAPSRSNTEGSMASSNSGVLRQEVVSEELSMSMKMNISRTTNTSCFTIGGEDSMLEETESEDENKKQVPK